MSQVVVVAQVGSKWDWGTFLEFIPTIAKGLLVTVLATIFGITVGMILGLVLALARRSKWKVISWPAAAIIEFIRSTPLLVQLFLLFFGLGALGLTINFDPLVLPGLNIPFGPPFLYLVIGLGIHYGAYTSESYRAGIESVGKGQWEAAVALNLPTRVTWGSVVLPQAIPTVIPALGNYLVAMLKDAPLGSAIGVVGVLFAARGLASTTFQSTEAFTLVGIMFLAVSIPAAIFVRYLEKRYGYERS